MRNFVWVWLGSVLFWSSLVCGAQEEKIVWTQQEQSIRGEMRGLRALADDVRSGTTRELALKIRALPPSYNKVRLAEGLSNLSTEGDMGRETLQEVADTLAEALQEKPQPDDKDGGPASAYRELARLVRYEHVKTSFDAQRFVAAMKLFEEEDAKRQNGDFTLKDLVGKSWTLHDLKGQVVLVNFWATWCPPCRKEMPDLEALYREFHGKGFVVLAISADDAAKVRTYIEKGKYSYPVLLDAEGEVSKKFVVEGIPHSFVFDRDGKLVAQSTDMRTRAQFLAMLGEAGLKP